VFGMLIYRRGEDDNVIYIYANIGQVTQDARHDALELASKGLESKRSSSELVLNTVPSERQYVTMSWFHIELVE
jgi:hypothetical protein